MLAEDRVCRWVGIYFFITVLLFREILVMLRLANMTKFPISQGRVMIVDDRTSEKTACYSVKMVWNTRLGTQRLPNRVGGALRLVRRL